MPDSQCAGRGGQGIVIILPNGSDVIKVSELLSESLIRQAALEQHLGSEFVGMQGVVMVRDTFCCLISPCDLLGRDFGASFEDAECPRLMLVQTMDFIEGRSYAKLCDMVRVNECDCYHRAYHHLD